MSDQTVSAARDYRSTLFLPATDFPMKAGLPETEPKWLARWESMNLYGRIREASKGRPLFILHDGPIYANGDIHTGTGMNHILKDFVVRSQQMLGKDAPYVPGWDCHGLPIEWKVEEQYRAQGRDKASVPTDELRRDCRQFAARWLDVQREQIKRLGCAGSWGTPYTTMDFRAEAAIAGELYKFVDNGLLYRGFRPVMWSPVEKTALAEAEVEYHEKQSPAIYVNFPVVRSSLPGLTKQPTDIVIWTTTPWTIPGNRAIAYSPTMTYCVVQILEPDSRPLPITPNALSSEEQSTASSLKQSLDEYAKHLTDEAQKRTELRAKFGNTAFVVAESLFHDFREVIGADWTNVASHEFRGTLLHGTVCAHPFRGKGFDFEVPLLPGDHVTADTGTGFVHTAPGHGEEDFELGRKFGLEVPHTIDEEGKFYPCVPLFAGKRILTPDGKDGDANGAVIKELINAGALLAKGTLRHSYPHSWRSKAPVIFRATPQWFAALDKPLEKFARQTLRQLALQGIRDTEWVPPQGANRIGSMVETRPDWVLSRQRAWGVPLAIFVNKKSGEVLNDTAVNARILEIFRKEGADAWFTRASSDFLGGEYAAEDYEQVKDILDVWFDSGSTHVFTVEEPIEPSWPKADKADLYLEGSDQHRGWFQSSLLESCGTRGVAPYRAVLTHGFVLDEKGYKMSKSLGNTLAPQTIADKNGADILRLWAASSDFTEDLRIGQDIIKANVDSYRRLRNTIRFMLSNLSGFSEEERIAHGKMPELERYMLARLSELDASVRAAYEAFDFNRVYSALFNFCTNDLSAFYFDVRKDALYCDGIAGPRRRAARTVIDEIFRRVVTWFAPVLCFTMEEAWLARFPGDGESVHLHDFFVTPKEWADPALIAKWARIRTLRRVVTGALEIARRDKAIGASLEAAPVLYVEDAADAALFEGVDLAEIAITSDAQVSTGAPPEGAFRLPDVSGAAAVFQPAVGLKCVRCWMILPEVGSLAQAPDLCRRCADVVVSGGEGVA